MRTIKLLGIVGVATLAALGFAANANARKAEDQRRLTERIEKDRWESEGGANRTGPATQSAVSAN